MDKIINVLSIPKFRRGSNRDKWYERLVRFDGKPIEEFVASVKRDPPCRKDEPALGWISFFEKLGILKLTSDAEYTKHVYSYSDDPYNTIKGFAWFSWITVKWLILSGLMFVIVVYYVINGHPGFAVFFGIMCVFIAFAGFINDAAKPSEKKEERYYLRD